MIDMVCKREEIDINKELLRMTILSCNADIYFLESGENKSIINSILEIIKRIFTKIRLSFSSIREKMTLGNNKIHIKKILDILKEKNESIQLSFDIEKAIDIKISTINTLVLMLGKLKNRLIDINDVDDVIDLMDNSIKKLEPIIISPVQIKNQLQSIDNKLKYVEKRVDIIEKDVKRSTDIYNDAEVSDLKQLHIYIVRKISNVFISTSRDLYKIYMEIMDNNDE